MDRPNQSLKYGRHIEVSQEYGAPEVQQPDLEAVQPGLEASHFRQTRYETLHGSPRHGISGQEKAHDTSEKASSESRICGLRKTTFWLALALAVALILAIAIGGGLGASMNAAGPDSSRGDAQLANESHPTTVTVTSTTTQQVATATPSSQCPDANLQNWTGTDPFYGTGLTYTKVCGVDLNVLASKTNVARGTFQGFDACIEMCDSINA